MRVRSPSSNSSSTRAPRAVRAASPSSLLTWEWRRACCVMAAITAPLAAGAAWLLSWSNSYPIDLSQTPSWTLAGVAGPAPLLAQREALRTMGWSLRHYGEGRRLRDVFILTTYGSITPWKRALFQRYSTELAGVMEFWVVYDKTCRQGESWGDVNYVPSRWKISCRDTNYNLASLRSLTVDPKLKPNFRVFVWDDEAAAAAYPLYGELGGGHPFDKPVAYVFKYFAFSLWLGHFIGTLEPGEALGEVWINEDDHVFAGRVSEFMAAIRGDETLRGVDYLSPLIYQDPYWFHRLKNTWPIHESAVYIALEFLQRFSPRLALTLRDMVAMNVVTYGEAFPATICRGSSWCSDAPLPARFLPPPEGFPDSNATDYSVTCLYAWNCGLTIRRWRREVVGNVSRHGRWYHAAKFVQAGDRFFSTDLP